MILKIQTKENETWISKIKSLTSRFEKMKHDGTFSDFDVSFIAEIVVEKWKDSGKEIAVFLMTVLGEDLKKIYLIADKSADIYLLNDNGETIDIVNRA